MMHTQSDPTARPGRVLSIQGVVFQCDAGDRLTAPLVRAVEELSRCLRSGSHSRQPLLANHAGVRVRLALPDGSVRSYVVELLPRWPWDKQAGLPVWTPLLVFRSRDRGGWDVTVPAHAFAGIGRAEIRAALRALNASGQSRRRRALCTHFIEHLFGGKAMFSDLEVLHRLWPALRLPEPAAPRLRAGARLSDRAQRLLNLTSCSWPAAGGRALRWKFRSCPGLQHRRAAREASHQLRGSRRAERSGLAARRGIW